MNPLNRIGQEFRIPELNDRRMVGHLDPQLRTSEIGLD